MIAKKYRALMRDEPEELINRDSEEMADTVSEVVPNNVAAAPPP